MKTLLNALTAFLQAATAYLERWHLWKLAQLESEIHGIRHQIYMLGKSGTPADLLQIDVISADLERLCALRSTFSDVDKG